MNPFFKKRENIIFSVFVVLMVLIGFIGFFSLKEDYIKDVIFSVILSLLLLYFYNPLRMTPLSYGLVSFSLFLHNISIFGFYAESPFLVPYDYITHFVGIFSSALVACNFLSHYFSKDFRFRKNDSLILFVCFISGLGIGSIVETMEFGGYLLWGEGEGFFQFGEGDYEGLNDPDKMTLIVGGGYFDCMEDLIANSLGAMSAVLLFGVSYFKLGRKRI